MATSNGLFMPDGTFQPFQNETTDPVGLAMELATRETAGEYYLLGLGLLPDPDPVLRKRGDDVVVLQDLTADDQVVAAMQSRKVKTLNKRRYHFTPGHQDGKEPTEGAVALCRDLERDLERVDLLALFSEVLDAPYFGYTVAELLWKPLKGKLALADVVAKPRRWFGFDDLNRLCFQRGDGGLDVVPQGKCVLVRHFPTYDNPYGLRLLSRCLWPVVFKRGGIQFWMRFAERFGIPWVVAHSSTNDENVRRKMLGQLTAMVQDAVAVISGSDKVDIHDASGKAGDLHKAMVTHWDAAISRVLMGQTLTSSDGGGKGSYALGQTHYAVLQDYADCDETLVATFMTDLAWTYGQVNAPGERSPVFEFIQPEDHAARAELDVKLKDTGVKFTKAHYVKTYGMAEDEFEIPGDGQAPQGPEFSRRADRSFSQDTDDAQQALDRMVAAALPEAVKASEASVREILDLVDKAESYEDLQLLLSEALAGVAGDKAMEDALAEILVAAELYGRWDVQAEGGDE